MTEVIVIVFLVAIGAIGIAGLFGDNIRKLFGSSSEAVAGNPSAANTGKEATQTKWTLQGGSLSAYNSGGTLNSPAPTGGGFNPGATPNSASPSPGGGFNPGGAVNHAGGGGIQ